MTKCIVLHEYSNSNSSHSCLLNYYPFFQFMNKNLTKWSSVFLQFIMKMYRAINGRTSGSGHGLQVHRTSWTRSDEGRQPAGSCRTGSGCPWSPSWRLHPHLQGTKKTFKVILQAHRSVQSVNTFSILVSLQNAACIESHVLDCHIQAEGAYDPTKTWFLLHWALIKICNGLTK